MVPSGLNTRTAAAELGRYLRGKLDLRPSANRQTAECPYLGEAPCDRTELRQERLLLQANVSPALQECTSNEAV